MHTLYYRNSILNLACLGYPILKDVKAEGAIVKTGRRQQLRRKERDGTKYVVSRWIPIIQDIMEVYKILRATYV